MLPIDAEAPPEIVACQKAFELSGIPAGIVTLEGRPLWFSSAFPALLGFTPEEFAGQSAAERIHPDDVPSFQKRLNHMADRPAQAASTERRYRHKNGHYLWLSVSSTTIRDGKGNPSHFVGIFQDITERKKKDQELKENKEYFNLILESLQDVVWSFSPSERRLHFMNEAATRALYLRSPKDFYDDPDLWVNAAHPDDRPRVRAISARLPSGSSEDIYRIVRPDGTLRWVHSRAWCTKGADGQPLRYEGVIRDVTDAQNAEMVLRDSEARLQLVIEAGNFGIWQIDRNTRATYWTPALRNLLGVPPDYPASLENFAKLIFPEDRERASKEFYDLGTGAEYELNPFRIVRPDGTQRWVQGFGKFLSKSESDQGKVIGALMDITDAKVKEQLIEAQRLKLFAAAKMSALGEMAGGLAHEINNPVAIIHGNATLLRQQAARGQILPSGLEKTAETIEQTAERISKIIRALRAFARNVEQDPFEIVSVKNIISETAELCRARFHLRNIDFRIDAIDDNLRIEARSVQISQVLLNLLNNAFDATETLPAPWIRVHVIDEAQHVQIQVFDSGPGIPEPLREKIFQPFFTTKEIGKGTGLGLSVSTGIVETHSGTLDLDTSHAHTCFVLRLPKKQK